MRRELLQFLDLICPYEFEAASITGLPLPLDDLGDSDDPAVASHVLERARPLLDWFFDEARKLGNSRLVSTATRRRLLELSALSALEILVLLEYEYEYEYELLCVHLICRCRSLRSGAWASCAARRRRTAFRADRARAGGGHDRHGRRVLRHTRLPARALLDRRARVLLVTARTAIAATRAAPARGPRGHAVGARRRHAEQLPVPKPAARRVVLLTLDASCPHANPIHRLFLLCTLFAPYTNSFLLSGVFLCPPVRANCVH